MKSNTLRFPLLAGLLLSLLWISVSLPVQAEEHPEESGTIEIRLEASSSGRSWKGVVFEAVRCADLSENGLAFFEPYQDCSLTLDQMDDSESMKQALTYLEKQAQTAFSTAAVSEEGTACFESLPYGLYLIRVSDPADYDLIGNVLALVPGVDEESETLKQRIVISAKTYPLPDLEILKTDEQRQPILNSPFAFGAFRQEDDSDPIETKQADPKSGSVCFRLRLNQTLYLRELEAPAGYERSERTVKAHLAADGTLYLNNRKQTARNGRVSMEFANRKLPGGSSSSSQASSAPSLSSGTVPGTPRTAQKASTGASAHIGRWLILAVVSLLSLAGFWIGFRRRRRHTVRF